MRSPNGMRKGNAEPTSQTTIVREMKRPISSLRAAPLPNEKRGRFRSAPKPDRRGRLGRRARRWLLAVPASIVLAFGGYSCAASHALQREINSTPRDASTGVVPGTESIDLEPANGESATSACLLLHGWSTSRKDFGDLGVCLAEAGYHVRLARLPGHGTTPIEFGAQTPETLLDGAREEYRALRARYPEVNLIGFSMGGTLATLLSAEQPPDALVLVAPYFGIAYQWYYGLPPETWNSLTSWAMPYVAKPRKMIPVNRPGAAESIFLYRVIPTQAVTTLVRLGEEARTEEVLQCVRCRVLLVMSEGDMAASPARARAAFNAIGSTTKEARWYPKRSNHYLLLDYDGEAAKAAILEFLRPRSPASP